MPLEKFVKAGFPIFERSETMGQKGVEIRTRLSVKECAGVFQGARLQGVGSKLGGLGAKVAGHDNSGFFTPTDNSPFSALDDDKPTFSVGVFVPKFSAGAQGNGTALHMYVWDRGDSREVQIVAPHGFGGGMHAGQLVSKMTEAFRSVDGSIAVAT